MLANNDTTDLEYSSKYNSRYPRKLAYFWNERGYGLANPSTAASSDSIVGTARESASQSGRPRPSSALQRACSTAAFEVFVDEDINNTENENDLPKDDSAKITDHRSLRQRVDGGAVSGSCLLCSCCV